MAKIFLPDSVPGPETVTLAMSLPSLSGARIAVLDNGKPNANVVMTRAAEALAARVTISGPGTLSGRKIFAIVGPSLNRPRGR